MTTKFPARMAWVAALLALPLASPALAQPLTVDKAVEIALHHNSQVVTSQADIYDARSGVLGAEAGLLPRIGASYTRNGSLIENQPFSGTRVISSQVISGTGQLDVETYSTSPVIEGSWAVLDFSAIRSVQSARSSLKATELRHTSTQNDVVAATRQAFYDVVTAIKLSQVSSAALKVARDDERRVRALFDVGSVARSDVLTAQVRTAQAEFDSLSSIQNVVATRVGLSQQIGISESELGDVDTLLTAEPRIYDEASLLQEARRNRPDLAAANAELQAANAGVSAARYARLPYVTLSGSITFDPKFNQYITATSVDSAGHSITGVNGFASTEDREWSGAIALNLPIFDRTLDSRSAAAKAALIRARENKAAIERNLTSQIHGVLLIYDEAIERDAVARRAVESASENLNLLQQKYNVGSATALELVQAEVQLQTAQSTAVSALAQLRVAEAQIERVRGSGR